MKEQDLLRIVRNMLSSIVDLVDSDTSGTKIPAVLVNTRNGSAGFISLLDEVIVNQAIEDASEVEDITEKGK